MLEYGLSLLFSLLTLSFSASGVPSLSLPILPRWPTTSYAWKGLRNTLFCFAGLACLFGATIGEACRLLGAG